MWRRIAEKYAVRGFFYVNEIKCYSKLLFDLIIEIILVCKTAILKWSQFKFNVNNW